MTAKEEVDNLINEFTAAFMPFVKETEASISITKGHYGSYMPIVSRCSGNNAKVGKLVCAALLRAGANSYGVREAYKVIFQAYP